MPSPAHSLRTLVAAALVVPLATSACGSDPAAPEPPTLVGAWQFSDNARVWDLLAGSMTFAGDGTLTIEGSVADGASGFAYRSRNGAWSRNDDVVTLTVDGETTAWRIELSADAARFLELGGGVRWFRLFKPGPD